MWLSVHSDVGVGSVHSVVLFSDVGSVHSVVLFSDVDSVHSVVLFSDVGSIHSAVGSLLSSASHSQSTMSFR